MNYRKKLPLNKVVYIENIDFDIEPAIHFFKDEWFDIIYLKGGNEENTYTVRPHPSERRENQVIVQDDNKPYRGLYIDRIISVCRRGR